MILISTYSENGQHNITPFLILDWRGTYKEISSNFDNTCAT
jgi:hypothetical protein